MSKTFRTLILISLLAGCSFSGNYANAPRSLRQCVFNSGSASQFSSSFQRPPNANMGSLFLYKWQLFGRKVNSKQRLKPHEDICFGYSLLAAKVQPMAIAQVLDGTWEEYKSTAGRWGARRSNIRDATDFMGWYMAQSRRNLGISMWDTRNQYLAYHEGRNGYRKGSYKSKRWLISIANNLQKRTEMYKSQLISCGKG